MADKGAVRDMFNQIAGKYDFLNHFLSLNIDRYWRRRLLKSVKNELKLGNIDRKSVV